MDYPVLITKKINFPLTYKSGALGKLKVGDIVTVPFGKSEEIGVIWDKKQITKKKFKTKTIKKKLNYKLDNKLIRFINSFSAYNLSSKGMALKMCLGNINNFKKDEKYFQEKNFNEKNNFKLNFEQKKALDELLDQNKSFKVSVLQGITGSGKTHVYFENVKKILRGNNQVLILFPEITLTNQFEKRFKDFFGFKPSVWHSRVTVKERRKIWQGVSKNKIKVVLGARSALLLPFKSLKLIIVDEEHDASYKQEEGPIYNARDMAILRSSIEKIPINLISSIPSIETYNNCVNNKYKLIKIKKRYQNYPLAKTKIIGIGLENKRNYISEESFKIAKKFLDKNNQVLFFLNRRGHSTLLICKKCGYRFICPNCSVYLTYHKNQEKLICHYCGIKKDPTNKCKHKEEQCDFYKYGPGVEKIFEEVKYRFPNKKVKIFSSDYLINKKKGQNIIEEIENNKIDIIIGTQLISKGFNFKNLNCIIVVDSDFSGKGYDLRSTEKNIQLFNQLSGRAGRYSSDSIIVYQTLTPNNFLLTESMINNPETFLDEELDLRKSHNLPPFKRLIAIIISAKSQELSFKGAQQLKNELKKIGDIDILGPVESPLAKIKNTYRSRLLIKSESSKFIQKKIAISLENLKISSKIKLTVDVDPINFS